MVRGLLRTSNLPQLQNLIKRDPVSYKEEFLQQWNHYNSIRQIFQISPDEQTSHFRELVTFISQARHLFIHPKPIHQLFSRSHNSILQRLPSFLHICPVCSWRAMAHFPPISVKVSFRIWSCSRIRASSLPLSTEIYIFIVQTTLNIGCSVSLKRCSHSSLERHPLHCAESSVQPFSQTLRQLINALKTTSLIVLCKLCFLAWLSVEWVGRSWETRVS